MSRRLLLPILLLLLSACVDDMTFRSLEPRGRQFHVRDRTAEALAVPPESLRVREARAVQELVDRFPTQEAKDEIRWVIDRNSTYSIVSIPGDSTAAELVSLIYALRFAEKRHEERSRRPPTPSPHVETGEPSEGTERRD